MRIVKPVAALALAGLLALPAAVVAPLGTAAAEPSSPGVATASVGDAPAPATHVVALDDVGIRDPGTLQVEPTTGRILVEDGDGPTRVFESDGSYVGQVASTEVVVAYGSLYQMGFDGTSSTIEEIDPQTLTVSRTWTLGTGVSGGFGLHAAHGALYWIAIIPFSSDINQYRLDRATGAVQSLRTYIDQAGFIGGGNQRVRVGWSGSAASTPFYLSDGLNSISSTVSVAASQIGGRAIAPDGKQVVAASFNQPTELVAVDITPSGLVDQGVRYPALGPFDSFALSGGDSAAVALMSARPNATMPVVQVFPRNESVPVAELPVADGGTSMAFSPDGSDLYVLQPLTQVAGEWTIQLLVADLATSVGAPTPRVVGRAGGATITIPYQGVAPASVNVGPIAAPSTFGPDTITSPVPRLELGPAAVQVINELGIITEAASPLQVVELGPFGTVQAFTGRQYGDVLGRAPTAAEVGAETQALADGTPAGALPAALVRSRSLTVRDAALVRLYQAVFRRLPDTSGYRYWLAKLEGGTTLAKAAATFAGSSEFQRTYGSLGNGPFIDLVYQNVLGRAPDPGGRAYWLRKLAAGTSRGTLVAQFSQSSEYVTKTITTVERVRLVLAMFDRMPTQAELDFVAAQSLDQVAQALLTALQYPSA